MQRVSHLRDGAGAPTAAPAVHPAGPAAHRTPTAATAKARRWPARRARHAAAHRARHPADPNGDDDAAHDRGAAAAHPARLGGRAVASSGRHPPPACSMPAPCAKSAAPPAPSAAEARATDGDARRPISIGRRRSRSRQPGLGADLSAADAGDAAVRRRHLRHRRAARHAAGLHRSRRRGRSVANPLLPPRGDIVDRNNVPLAQTINAWSIAVHPQEIIGDRREIAERLAVLMPERTRRPISRACSAATSISSISRAAPCPSWSPR